MEASLESTIAMAKANLPTLLLVVVIVGMQGAMFNSINRQFERIDEQFERFEERFERFEERVDARFDRLEGGLYT